MPKMNTETYSIDPVLEEDRYPATLVEVKEYTRDFGEGPVEKLAWIFEVSADEDAVEEDIPYDGDFEGTVQIAAHTSYATSQKSKFYQIGLAALAGDDWDGDTDTLIGMECVADVEQYEGRDGTTRNAIGKVRPPKKTKKAAKKKTADKEAEDDGVNFDDIPFD